MGQDEILFLFTRIHFEKEMRWVSLPCLKASLLPLLTVQTLSITLSDRLSSSVPVSLNVPVTSESAFLRAPDLLDIRRTV